jgi:uncharacterized protein YjbJ (UPF0337 family)
MKVMSLPGVQEIKRNWAQQVGAARIAWDKLSHDELLQSEGQAQKLIHLVRRRYTITRGEANRQVKSFIGFIGQC